MKRFLEVLLLIGMPVFSLGCRSVYQAEDTVMGPIIARITVVSDHLGVDELKSAVEAAFAEVHRVDALMSHYKPDSDITRLNEAPPNEWVEVDPLTFAVLEQSHKVSELTGGAFDPTVMPLVSLWGFWPVRQLNVPSEEEIRQTRMRVGYRKLSLDSPRHAVRKAAEGVTVDLGGIAKGCAVDRAIEALRRRGVTDALVEIGGETRVMGKNKDGRLWRIGVLHPARRGYLAVLELSDMAVATSGDYMNCFVLDGKRYSHLIDPHTGKPVSNEIAGVTILNKECLKADALATAVSAMGLEKGMQLIESLPGTEAMIARRKGDGGEIEVLVSTGLKGLRLTP